MGYANFDWEAKALSSEIRADKAERQALLYYAKLLAIRERLNAVALERDNAIGELRIIQEELILAINDLEYQVRQDVGTVL